MPVYKRAPRPMAAFASDPRKPRETLTSENDFTVLFERKKVDELRSGLAQTRQVAPPRPAPKPPVAERPKTTAAPDPDDWTPEGTKSSSAPPGVVVPARDRIQIVAVQPRLRERALRVAVFLALGGTLGVGVESVVRHPPRGAPVEPPAAAAVEAPPIPTALGDAAAESRAGASITVSNDKAVVVPAPHHHHHHHAASPTTSPSATPPIAVATADAGIDLDVEGDDDDMSEAVKTLTRAKGEVTLP